MTVDIRLAKPAVTEFTLTATLTLDEWKKIQQALDRPAEGSSYTAYPMSTLASAIRNLVKNAEERTEANLADRY